jgi:hypothetical protein
MIVSRLLQTDTLDGKGKESPLKLVSLYTDQKPEKDISRFLAASHRFRVSESIEDALTLGTRRLAVDGVLLIADMESIRRLPRQHSIPKTRRFWEETLKVFRASDRVVPVFIDKHRADNWQDAKFIYDSAKEMKIPLMAGSSVPGHGVVPGGRETRARLREIVAITYHLTEHYGFHGLEMVQALAERRKGGESGIKGVQTITGEAVWRRSMKSRSIRSCSTRPGSDCPSHEVAVVLCDRSCANQNCFRSNTRTDCARTCWS